jgi:hypothetical protein
MRKYLVIYEEAVSHIWICNSSLLDFLIYEEIFFFSSVQCCGSVIYWPPRSGSVILLLWIWSLTIYRRFKKFKKKVQLPVWQHIFTNGHKNIEVGYVCGWSAKNYPPGSVIRGHRSKDPDKYLRIPTLLSCGVDIESKQDKIYIKIKLHTIQFACEFYPAPHRRDIARCRIVCTWGSILVFSFSGFADYLFNLVPNKIIYCIANTIDLCAPGNRTTVWWTKPCWTSPLHTVDILKFILVLYCQVCEEIL